MNLKKHKNSVKESVIKGEKIQDDSEICWWV